MRAENERRRLAKEEADRIAFEKAERKRLKLEFKLRRRENRRLFALEKVFTEIYAASADIEKDLINLADLDGSDNNGLKSMGLRGGLLGEIFFQLQHMKKIQQFEMVGTSWSQFATLMNNFWQSLVGEGWTVLIGQDPVFERNIIPVMEGLNLDRLDTEFLRALSGQDTKGLVTYLKAHFRNNFLDSRFPGLISRRERLLKMLKYVPPAEDQGDDKKSNADDKSGDKDYAQITLPAPENDPETTPEQTELLHFLDSVFNLIVDENSDIYSIRFAKIIQKAPEEKKDDDGGELIPPTPKVTAIFIPVPPPVMEDAGVQDPPTIKVADPKATDTDPKPDGDGDDQGDDQKPPPEPEVLPFVPEEENFVSDFEPQISLVDYAKKDLDVACFHIPLVKAIASKLFAAAAQLLHVEGDLSQFVEEAVLAAVEDVRRFSKESGRDVLYINSY